MVKLPPCHRRRARLNLNPTGRTGLAHAVLGRVAGQNPNSKPQALAERGAAPVVELPHGHPRRAWVSRTLAHTLHGMVNRPQPQLQPPPGGCCSTSSSRLGATVEPSGEADRTPAPAMSCPWLRTQPDVSRTPCCQVAAKGGTPFGALASSRVPSGGSGASHVSHLVSKHHLPGLNDPTLRVERAGPAKRQTKSVRSSPQSPYAWRPACPLFFSCISMGGSLGPTLPHLRVAARFFCCGGLWGPWLQSMCGARLASPPPAACCMWPGRSTTWHVGINCEPSAPPLSEGRHDPASPYVCHRSTSSATRAAS